MGGSTPPSGLPEGNDRQLTPQGHHERCCSKQYTRFLGCHYQSTKFLFLRRNFNKFKETRAHRPTCVHTYRTHTHTCFRLRAAHTPYPHPRMHRVQARSSGKEKQRWGGRWYSRLRAALKYLHHISQAPRTAAQWQLESLGSSRASWAPAHCHSMRSGTLSRSWQARVQSTNLIYFLRPLRLHRGIVLWENVMSRSSWCQHYTRTRAFLFSTRQGVHLSINPSTPG